MLFVQGADLVIISTADSMHIWFFSEGFKDAA